MDCKKRVCDISDDEISELPEEILVSILSRLSLKEATKTSVLSSRWRYLWTYFNGDMCFSDSGIDWAEFVQRINGILKLHRASTVRKFTIEFLKVYSVEDIYPWIEFVASKDVKVFQLTLGNEFIDTTTTHTTLNLVKKDLKRFQLRLGPYSAMPYSGFGSLKTLHLFYVAVSDEAVQYMLSNSPNLEIIYFFKLIGLSCLSITSSSLLKLKELWLLSCFKLKEVNISSRSLEDLRFKGNNVRVNIDAKEVPELNKVAFGDLCCKSPSQLIYRLHGNNFLLDQLKSLSLELHLMGEYDVAAIELCKLPILKHLGLFISPKGGNAMQPLLNCINLLQTRPRVLHTLEITFLWRCKELVKETILNDKIVHLILNPSIKVVKLAQFFGHNMDTKILENVIESSKSLKKLIITPFLASKRWTTSFEWPEWAESRANDRIKVLCEEGILSKRYLPSRIELVIERN